MNPKYIKIVMTAEKNLLSTRRTRNVHMIKLKHSVRNVEVRKSVSILGKKLIVLNVEVRQCATMESADIDAVNVRKKELEVHRGVNTVEREHTV